MLALVHLFFTAVYILYYINVFAYSPTNGYLCAHSLTCLLAHITCFIIFVHITLSCVPTRWKDTHNLKLTKFCPTVFQSSYTIYIPI